MSMRIWDPHFLRYAGAEPARQMRTDQRKARNAYVSGLTYEKPLDSPDRPSNMDRKFQESIATKLPEVDNPSKIMASDGEFHPPVPEGQEITVLKDSPDNPSRILASIGDAAPPPESRPADAPPTPTADIPADQRSTLPSPEASTGLVVSETA